MTFSHLDIEKETDCNHDALIFYDGPDVTSHETERLCGQSAPPALYSTSRHMTVKFKSDASKSSTGFVINFSGTEPVVASSGMTLERLTNDSWSLAPCNL